MLRFVLIALVLFVVALFGMVAMQPAEFRVERSASMAAPVGEVFAQVNDLHNWQQWSPWAKRDPAMQTIFEGPSAGVGAISRWVGNNEVGEGSMTILESRPDELIRFKLEFLKPFEATNDVVFRFVPEGENTRVTWSMTGSNNFIGKAVHMLMDMDKMVGGDFEQGLAQLKAQVEESSRP